MQLLTISHDVEASDNLGISRHVGNETTADIKRLNSDRQGNFLGTGTEVGIQSTAELLEESQVVGGIVSIINAVTTGSLATRYTSF